MHVKRRRPVIAWLTAITALIAFQGPASAEPANAPAVTAGTPVSAPPASDEPVSKPVEQPPAPQETCTEPNERGLTKDIAQVTSDTSHAISL